MLPDILPPGLEVVFVGTAAGTESARQGVYYAHPHNRFWPTLKAIGLVPADFERRDFARAPEFGVGFTDLCKTRSGMDHTLRHGDFDVPGLRGKLKAAAPRCVAFTSRKGASVFLARASAQLALGVPILAAPDLPPVFALPSPSGAAAGHWDITPWRKLAAYLAARQTGMRR